MIETETPVVIPALERLNETVERTAAIGRRVRWKFSELLEANFPEPGFLVEGLLPQGVLGMLCGVPDSGKSMFARHLVLSVCLGQTSFLGYRLNVQYRKAIYVVTEDSNADTRRILSRQLGGLGGSVEEMEGLEIVTADELNYARVLEELEGSLEEGRADLIVIDALADVMAGTDGNDNLRVREVLKPFHSLANRFGCHILFVAHVNKSRYDDAPDQSHVQGAAAHAQKVRVILDLRPQHSDDSSLDLKVLSVTKGNYLPRSAKERSTILVLDSEWLIYRNTGQQRRRQDIGQSKTREKDIAWEEIFGQEPSVHRPDLVRRVADLCDMSPKQALRRIRKEFGDGRDCYLNPFLKSEHSAVQAGHGTGHESY